MRRPRLGPVVPRPSRQIKASCPCARRTQAPSKLTNVVPDMKPKTIDEYIAPFSPEIQAILQNIRTTVHETVPDAVERISYRMPNFALNGSLVYFAAFKNHI